MDYKEITEKLGKICDPFVVATLQEVFCGSLPIAIPHTVTTIILRRGGVSNPKAANSEIIECF